MAVAIAAGAPVTGAGVSSVTATVPGSIAGDISVMCVYMYGAGTLGISVPAGWTSLGYVAAGGSSAAGGIVVYRAWQPGDPTTVVWAPSQGGVARIVVQPFRLRGAKTPLTPSANLSIAAISAGGSINAPSLTAPAAGDLLVTFHGARRDGTSGAMGTFTKPASMTQLMQNASAHATQANIGGLVSYKQLTAAGATGTQAATNTVAVRGGSWSFIVPRKVVSPTTMRRKGGAAVSLRYKGQP